MAQETQQKNAMQSKQHSELTRKHMISLTNRHISSTDKGKLVYSTLALNQTRESVKKNSSRPFSILLSFISHSSLSFLDFCSRQAFRAHKKKLYHHVALLSTAIIYFPLDMMRDTKIMSDSSCCCSSISS